MFLWKDRKQFWGSRQKFFTRRQKKNYGFVRFFKQKISPNIFPWKMRKQFWQNFRKFFNRSPKKHFEPITFSDKSFLLKNSSEYIESSFDITAKKFQPKPEEHWWIYKAFVEKISRKVFSWEKRMKFWQPCWKFLKQKPEQNLWT